MTYPESHRFYPRSEYQSPARSGAFCPLFVTAHLIRKHPNLAPRFSPAPDQGRQRVRESSASATASPPVIRSSSASMSVSRLLLHVSTESNRTPNHALQRTPGFGVQLPGAALVRPAQSRAVLPAMKPGTARAFALRRRAHSRAPGPESLSLGSLGDARALNLATNPYTNQNT